MKRAFTMIEMIFIIAVIGILVSIATTKLFGTRNDARKVIEINKIADCINDLTNSYWAQGKENNNTFSCKNLKCAVVDIGNPEDGNITVILKDESDGYPKFCNDVKDMAEKRKMGGVHSFGGSKLVL